MAAALEGQEKQRKITTRGGALPMKKPVWCASKGGEEQ